MVTPSSWQRGLWGSCFQNPSESSGMWGQKALARLHLSGIFLSLIWGQISAPSQLKNEQKLPKMVYIIPKYLVLHFGENFMKIRTKIAKLELQMHKNWDKNVNENMFLLRAIKATNMVQLYTANFLYICIHFFNQFKMACRENDCRWQTSGSTQPFNLWI